MGNNFIPTGGNLWLSVKPTWTYSWVEPSRVPSEVPTGSEIDLDIDQYLDEIDHIYMLSELNAGSPLDDTNSTIERECGIRFL